MLNLRNLELDLNKIYLGFEAFHEPLFVFNLNHEAVFTNNAASKMIGGTIDISTPLFQEALKEALEKTNSIQREIQNWTVTFHPLKEASGSTTGVLISMRQATATEHRFRELFDNVTLLTVGLNLQGYVTFINRHFSDVTGWAKEEVLGLDWFGKFVPESETKSIIRYFLRALSGKFPRATYESSITTKNGETKIVSWHSTAFKDPQGQIIGLTSIGEDVTEKRANENKLKEQREQILAFVSHELRSPLISIQALVDMASEEMSSPQALAERFKSINDQVKRIDLLSKDLLESCVHRTGELQFKFSKMDLGLILQRVAKNFKVELTVPSVPMIGFFDESRLEQVFSNLLSNALKYSLPEKNHVKISASLIGSDLVRVSVSDQGIGIPPENLETIFELFSRAPNATKIETKGFGIGLKIAKDFIRKHSGKIWVESELGKGSTFHVELPLNQAQNLDGL